MTTAVQDIEEIQTLLQTEFPQIVADGDIGKRTRAAVASIRDPHLASQIQAIIARKFPIDIDGQVGPQTMAALVHLDEAGDAESIEEQQPINHPSVVHASFFAGPQDVNDYTACIRKGWSQVKCFGLGDNGIGLGGADCTSQTRPMAALPREVWQDAGKKMATPLHPGSGIAIEYDGKRIVGELGDTMPSLANIHNGMGIDLNPGFAVALGINPERMNDYDLKGVAWFWTA